MESRRVGGGGGDDDAENLDGVRARLLFKLIMVGDSGAGKSCLLRAFHEGTFDHDSESTIGVDFCTKKVRVAPPPSDELGAGTAGAAGSADAQTEGEVVKLQIWDTAGHERFRAITHTYFRNAAGCLLVCDATRPVEEAERSVAGWTEAVRAVTPDAVFVVVASKCDLVKPSPSSLEREGTTTMLRASAKSGEGVAEAFGLLVGRVYRERALPALLRSSGGARPAARGFLEYAETRVSMRRCAIATGVTHLEGEGMLYKPPTFGPGHDDDGGVDRITKCPKCAVM